MRSASVIGALTRAIEHVPGGTRLLQELAFRTTPNHVLSYPTSGRTWLRVMLGRILVLHFEIHLNRPGDELEPHRLARIDLRVPSIRFSHDDNPYMKPVAEIERTKSRYRTKNVVLLARDPRDIVVSNYYQQTRRAPSIGEPGFEGPIKEFIRHPHYGIENIVTFLNVWAHNRQAPRRFLLLRYEDLKSDPGTQLRRLLAFLDISGVSDDTVSAAVEVGRFENMQRLEKQDAYRSDDLRPADPDDPSSFKARRGHVGGYVEELDEADQAFVDGIVRRDLNLIYGYEEAGGTAQP